jgi:hypothetical protein
MIKNFFTNTIAIICICTICFLIKDKTAFAKTECGPATCKQKAALYFISNDEKQKDIYPHDGFFIKI